MRFLIFCLVYSSNRDKLCVFDIIYIGLRIIVLLIVQLYDALYLSVSMQGRFEILSLSGSFLLSDNGGQRSRAGGLSVSLSGPDGRVLGGGVAGLLTASSPVQVN